MARTALLDRLYSLFDDLERRIGGARRLGDCDGYMDWPDRGVYFVFSPDETRVTGEFPRLTRVGTHAVSRGSGSTLWERLRTHRGAQRGTYVGGGNHRGSVFRERVGEALIERHGLHETYPTWGKGSSAGRERRLAELDLERRVSDYVRRLPFLWVTVDDEPGPESDRAFLERNTIALASNYRRESVDPRDERWLGRHSPSESIRCAGLWNVDHVEESPDPAFLDRLAEAVEETEPP